MAIENTIQIVLQIEQRTALILGIFRFCCARIGGFRFVMGVPPVIIHLIFGCSATIQRAIGVAPGETCARYVGWGFSPKKCWLKWWEKTSSVIIKHDGTMVVKMVVYITGWCFGTCFIFHQYGIILPIDEVIFFKMVKTTNQININE